MNKQANHQASDQDGDDTTIGSVAKSASGRHRRFAVLGVAAGLLGGGAIGLLATTPSFSSAASSTSAISASVTEPTDDTATSTTADETTDPAETTDRADRPNPSVRLRESLQTLVDDGTISADQADAVATHLGSVRGDMGGPMGGGMGRHGGGRDGGGAHPEALAELLGLEVTEIRTAFEAGMTVAELAEANGVDVQTVIDGLVDASNTRIDQAVADGRLTDEEAVSKRAELVTRITEAVNTVRPAGGRHG